MTPFGALEWSIARRYLRARRRERAISVVSSLSITGIVLGVAALIIVMSVMNGFRTELFSRILGISGHVVVQSTDGMPGYDGLADAFEEIAGVQRAVPYVLGQAYATGNGGASGILLRGVSKHNMERTPLLDQHLIAGSLDEFGEGRGMVIGAGLARTLGVALGDRVQVMTEDGPVTPFGQTPQIDAFPVIAIFDVGMSQVDGTIAYLPLADAQLFLNMEDAITGIEIFADSPDDMEGLKAEIAQASDRPLYMSDWRQNNRAYYSALTVERNVMFIILTLIVLVASMNVISSMTMLVNEKTPDIAILRTIGATRGTILRIFLMVGLTIGVGGTLIGLALGTLIAVNIDGIRQGITALFNIELFPPELYYLTQIPSDISSTQTAMVVVISLVLALVATIPPAWKAAATDPVEALKAE
ncbi:lipoprotein-releasing ABC transporter permease subunit [Acuticoccus yangtzensis]|uniref:lipoprotein-releasing ABC transporter permease subunit n=1 Tax=Acuticoccus yangtzensis TaxID=1443441 RepID=UPI0009497403|nr:lipoprotein-releasing ABC transporter permease subunit [Acuticoccus yangtzensis]